MIFSKLLNRIRIAASQQTNECKEGNREIYAETKYWHEPYDNHDLNCIVNVQHRGLAQEEVGIWLLKDERQCNRAEYEPDGLVDTVNLVEDLDLLQLVEIADFDQIQSYFKRPTDYAGVDPG